MNIFMDIMENGLTVIYHLCEDERTIEEPCSLNLEHAKDGKSFVPTFFPMLMFSDSGKVQRHDQSKVLYSVRPIGSVHNMYVEALNNFRAQRTGIVAPTSAQVSKLRTVK